MINDGQIPRGWSFAKLGDLAEYVNGRGFKTTEWKTSGKPIIRIQNLTKEKSTYNYTNEEFPQKYFIKNGDLLFSWSASLGVYLWKGGDAWLNQHIFNVIPKKSTSKLFIYYLLKKITSELYLKAHGSGMVHVTKGKFEDTQIILPPLSEQHRIIEKIEELFSELDSGIENLKLAQKQLKIYRQAILKKAFEGGLTKSWRRNQSSPYAAAEELKNIILLERKNKYADEISRWEISGKKGGKPNLLKFPGIESADEIIKLSKLPKGWTWVKVGNLGLVGTGVTPLKGRIDFYENGHIPWVTSGALNDNFVTKASDYVTEAALQQTSLKIYPKNTLLVAMYGEGKTRGKCSELLIEASTNQAIAAIVLEGTAEKIRKYIKLFFQKNYDEIRLKSSGGVQPNLNLGIIENTYIPLCSLEEVGQVINEVEAILSRIDEFEQGVGSSIQQLDLLRQSILQKAFSGQLVSQDPMDEPASELLSRVESEIKKLKPVKKKKIS